MYDFRNLFNFDSFTFKINKLLLFKLSKSNPYLASMWQYLLIICNFQDPEYWQLSTEKFSAKYYMSTHNLNEEESDSPGVGGGDRDLVSSQNDFDCNSSSSSINNSLNPQIQQLSSTSDVKLRPNVKKTNVLQDQAFQQSSEHQRQSLTLSTPHVKHSTLNEQLFRYLSMTIYCDYIATRNQLDNTVGLTMILVNNLVELFELSAHEPNVWDLFSTIHR